MCFLAFPDTPPQKVEAKGAKGAQYGALLGMQGNPNQFAVGLKDACCVEPVACCLSGACTFPYGLAPCYFRSAILDKYHNGIQDFRCCQGFIPRCLCLDFESMFPGSELGLCLEGCCCPLISLSIARIHLMHTLSLRPDPMDYQIIECSNCLQCLALICEIFGDDDVADAVQCVADMVTLTVAGCMGCAAPRFRARAPAPAPACHECAPRPRVTGEGGGGGEGHARVGEIIGE